MRSNTTLVNDFDKTQAPNTAKAGINKSLADEIWAGRGDVLTPALRSTLSTAIRSAPSGGGARSSSVNLAVRDINSNLAIGTGLNDSCASIRRIRSKRGKRTDKRLWWQAVSSTPCHPFFIYDDTIREISVIQSGAS